MIEKYNRLNITTKKGLTFEIIIADWLKEGDYEFGKIELVDILNEEQGNDYTNVVEKLFEMCKYEDDNNKETN